MDINIIKSTANRFSADRFYTELFNIDPELKKLFPADLSNQKHKLTGAIVSVVKNVEDLSAIEPILSALGKRHKDFGVTADMYDTVGVALILSLDLQNDEEVTTWTEAYAVVSRVMQGGKL
jgi:hemoglobin-like flavoprotein